MAKRRKKPTATQRNITNINSYIKRVATTFGTNSQEYMNAVIQLKDFDTYSNYENVIQIRNTKKNRKQHQKIRAIKNRQKPIKILMRKYEKAYKESNKKESVNSFARWYAELSTQFTSLYDEIYNYLIPACETAGIAMDDTQIHECFVNEPFKLSQWQKVFELGAKDYETLSEYLSQETVNGYTDKYTGESYRYENVDFEGLDDYDEFN